MTEGTRLSVPAEAGNLLVLHEGYGDATIERIRKALDWAVEHLEIDPERVVFEDLIAKGKSYKLFNEPETHRYVLVIGNSAAQKLAKPKSTIHVEVQAFEVWSQNLDSIRESLGSLLLDWQRHRVGILERMERQKVESGIGTKIEAVEDRAAFIEANIDSLQKYLEVEIENRKPKAVLFSMEDTGTQFEIVDASCRLRVPIDQTVPVLASREVLQDETVREELTAQIQEMGFKNPFWIGVEDFLVLLRINCALVKSRCATLRIRVDDGTTERGAGTGDGSASASGGGTVSDP